MTAPTQPSAFLRIIPLADIKVGERYRKHFDGIEDLAASIKAVGLLQPIGVTADNQLVFGHRRLLALRMLGRETTAVKTVDANQLQAEHDENVCRQDFTLSEKVAIAEALRPEIEAAAKLRQSEAGGDNATSIVACEPGTTSHRPLEGNSLKGRTPQSRDVVAEAVGLSAKTLAKATAVIAAVKADPAKHAGVVERMDASGKASAAYRAVSAAPGPTPFDAIAAMIAKHNAGLTTDERSKLRGLLIAPEPTNVVTAPKPAPPKIELRPAPDGVSAADWGNAYWRSTNGY